MIQVAEGIETAEAEIEQVAPGATGNRVDDVVDDQRPVAERVRAAMEQHGFKQSAVANGAGMSKATLSLYLAGRYQSNPAEVEAKLVIWLRGVRESAVVQRIVPEPPSYFVSKTAGEISSSFMYAQGTGDIVAVAGVPGIGKTTTCAEYARTHSNVWVAEAASHTTGVVPVLKLVATAVGAEHAMGASGLASAIESRIARKNGLIIIDEAHHLALTSLDAIRALHDKTGVAIALVGGPDLLVKLEKMPQLFSRLGMRLVRPRVQPGDVAAQLDAWGITGREERRVLTKLAEGAGALRRVTKTLRLAGMLARDSVDGLTLQHINDAAATLSARPSLDA